MTIVKCCETFMTTIKCDTDALRHPEVQQSCRNLFHGYFAQFMHIVHAGIFSDKGPSTLRASIVQNLNVKKLRNP